MVSPPLHEDDPQALARGLSSIQVGGSHAAAILYHLHKCRPCTIGNSSCLMDKHGRSSHYAVTHMRNKNSNIQGRSPNVVKMIFHTIRNCS